MKKIVLFALVLILCSSLTGCINVTKKEEVKEVPIQTSKTDEKTDLVVYKSTQYSFSFSLPPSWKGYSIITDKWEGVDLEGSQNGKTTQTGPLIYIRHPQWTSQNPRQDIPIMIFSLAQWNLLQQEKFHIGAAPIGPSELGHNSEYVFALPARYNYAFLTGYEEVEDILKNNPLQTT